MSPTGRPSENAQGTLTAGLPVTSNGAVFAMFDSAAVSTSPIDAPGGGIRIAFIGVVGSARTSTRSSASP